MRKKFILILSLFAIALCIRAQVPLNGLVAYYPLNGSADDLSGNGNTGTNHGAVPCEDRFGIAGHALSFNGTDNYISVDYQFTDTYESEYSVSLWVKANSTQTAYAKLLCFPYSLTESVFPYHYFGFSYANDLGEPNPGAGYFDETGFIGSAGAWGLAPDTWNLLTFTFKFGQMTFYVNGQLTDQTTASKSQLYFPPHGFSIGSFSPAMINNKEFFNGCIDELLLYNRCLSAEEILSNYNSSFVVSEEDSLALVALYNSTNGGSWNNNSNWLTGPVSDWEGVTVEYGQIIELSLQANNLEGTLTEEIGVLDNLNMLKLSENKLSGIIPPAIGGCKSLTDIILNGNKLSGSIPVEFGNLTSLEYIQLMNNQLTGEVPATLGNLNQLEIIQLDGNQLSGELPAEFNGLNNLFALTISSNNLSGLTDLSGLPYLTYLWVSKNELSFGDLQQVNIPPSNLSFTYAPQKQLGAALRTDNGNGTSTLAVSTDGTGNSYQWFNDGDTLEGQTGPSMIINNNDQGLYFCEISNPEFPDLLLSSKSVVLNLNTTNGVLDTEYNALLSLYISLSGTNWINNSNWLTDADVEDWYGITTSNYHVTEIRFIYNDLSGVIPAEIGAFSKLETLILGGNGISGVLTESMRQLEKLQGLYIFDTQISGNIPEWIGELSNLTSLNLFRNQLSGPIPASIENLKNLFDLSLENNMLTGPIPSELGNLTELQYIWLYNNHLEGSIPPALGNLENLVLLDLYNNSLSGSIPSELGNLMNLQELYLNSNQLTGIIPGELGNLSKLEKISLFNNRLSGAIPIELGNLTSLSRLSLGANDLTGPVPPELGYLSNLKDLWLHGNKLSGVIPPELGTLQNLESLIVNSNQLNGAVPSEINNLTNLTLLYINDNQLTNLPDLSSLTNLEAINISNNHFTFADLEASALDFDNMSTGIYAPQLELEDPVAVPGGNNILLQCHTNGNGDTYQWYKGGGSLTGEVSRDLIISNSDQGIFWCAVANNTFPELILSSGPYFNNIANSSGIVQEEYDALVDLYISTNGSDWTDQTNWITAADADNWYGIETTKGRIHKIDLNANNLVGNLPSSIGSFSEMEELYLHNNEISGNIPDELYNLTSLKELWIRENKFEGVISPLIHNLVNLETLQVRTNNFTGSIPPEIGYLTNLKGINLSQSGLEGALPASFNNLYNLEYLYIYETNLSDLPDLSSISNLVDFYPHSSRFTFEDFINTGIDFNTLATCIYAPQDTIPVTSNLMEIQQGAAITFNFQTLTADDLWSSQNEYALFKGHEFIADWTSNSAYQIPVASQADKGKYTIRIRNAAYPDLILYSDTIEISVLENQPPEDIQLSNAFIQENQPQGSIIGTFSSTDLNPTDTHTYTLVAGNGTNDADNGMFMISDNQLLTNKPFDFETKSVCNIYVQTQDPGGLNFQKEFVIEIGDLNESPTAIVLTKNTVAEDATIGSLIGRLTTEDEDGGDHHTYALTEADGESYPDNESFTVRGDSLLSNEEFDFETKAEYLINIITRDAGGLTFQNPLQIKITDVAEVGLFVKRNPTINVYPNPTNGIVSIEYSIPNCRIEVFDITGNKVIDEIMSEIDYELDLSDKKAGVYLIRIQQAEKMWMEKVIKY